MVEDFTDGTILCVYYYYYCELHETVCGGETKMEYRAHVKESQVVGERSAESYECMCGNDTGLYRVRVCMCIYTRGSGRERREMLE